MAHPLAALGDQAGDVVCVTVPDDPRVAEGATVTAEDLVALPWRRDGRTGVSLRARAITATTAPTAPADG